MELDRCGHFQAKVIGYAIAEQESGSVSVKLKLEILSQWNDETKEWMDLTQYEAMECYCDNWIIKKDGTLNENAAKNLAKVCGPWDFELIQKQEWQPHNVSISVMPETYNGVTKPKVKWLNPFDQKPGIAGNVSDDRISEFSGRFGSQLRALFGNATNAAPPTSRPKPPPAGMFTPAAKEPALNGAPGAGPLTGDKIPF